MATNFTLTIPISTASKVLPDFDVKHVDKNWIKQSVKETLEQWLSQPHEAPFFEGIATDSSDDNIRIMISFGGISEKMLKTIQEHTGLKPNEICNHIFAQLASGQQDDNTNAINTEPNTLRSILEKAGFKTTRKEQESFFLQIQDTLLNNHVGLSEASTGTGKTFAILIAAAEKAVATQTRVAITVPTIALMTQYKSQYERIDSAISEVLGESPQLRLMFGRREFISERQLSKYIENNPDPAAIKFVEQWLKHSSDEDIHYWLTTSFEKASLDADLIMPLSDLTLSEIVAPDDRGYNAYKAQFECEKPHECEILVFTHAMLAIDMRTRISRNKDALADYNEEINDSRRTISAIRTNTALSKKESIDLIASQRETINQIEKDRGLLLAELSESNSILPHYRHLIVDEAHQFESNISRVLSDYVSLRKLISNIEDLYSMNNKTCSRSLIKSLKEAVDQVSSIHPGTDGDETISLNFSNDKKHPKLMLCIQQITEIANVIKVPPSSNDLVKALANIIKRDVYVLRMLINGSYGLVQFSPVRRYPQVFVGKPSLDSFISQLWHSLDCAALVSATLYLPKASGYSAWYIKSILNLPAQTREYIPNVPAFIYRPICMVYQPESTSEIAELSPPKYKSYDTNTLQLEKDNHVWHLNIAKKINKDILPTMEGGALVLVTSYVTAKEVGEAISSCQAIIAKEGYTIAQQKRDFLNIRASGKPCIWITCGAAWVGLDISGSELNLQPAQDDVVTDLVIPRMPYNMNRSINHQHRKTYRPTINWEIFETAFFFRQGLGRFVRSDGLKKNRRLWVLDGRLKGEDAAMHRMLQDLLLPYINISR